MTVQASSPLAAGLSPTESSASYSSIRRGDSSAASSSSGAAAPEAPAAVLPESETQAAPPTPVVGGTFQVSLNPTTSQVVVQIVDGTSRQVILEIPAEDAIALAQAQGQTNGFLINAKA